MKKCLTSGPGSILTYDLNMDFLSFDQGFKQLCALVFIQVYNVLGQIYMICILAEVLHFATSHFFLFVTKAKYSLYMFVLHAFKKVLDQSMLIV